MHSICKRISQPESETQIFFLKGMGVQGISWKWFTESFSKKFNIFKHFQNTTNLEVTFLAILGKNYWPHCHYNIYNGRIEVTDIAPIILGVCQYSLIVPGAVEYGWQPSPYMHMHLWSGGKCNSAMNSPLCAWSQVLQIRNFCNLLTFIGLHVINNKTSRTHTSFHAWLHTPTTISKLSSIPGS